MEDVLAFHAEPVEDYVRRRHAELKTYGARNPEIFARLGEELAHRSWPRPSSASASCDGSSTAERAFTCAGSSGTSAASRPRRSCWRGWRGWSTAATTRPGSPSSARARRAGSGCQAGRPGPRPRRRAAEAVRRQGRHRPHPLGDPRPGERRQRPPAHRHQGRRRGRPQRDHRQRRRAAGRARGRRRRPGLRHRHRGARPPDRPLGGGDPGGEGGRGAGADRGHLRPRRAARRRSRTGSWSPATAAR